MDWFPYDRDFRHERVKTREVWKLKISKERDAILSKSSF